MFLRRSRVTAWTLGVACSVTAVVLVWMWHRCEQWQSITMPRAHAAVPIDDTVLPNVWRTGSLGMSASPLDPDAATGMRQVIDGELQKYPCGLLAECLDGVYLFEAIRAHDGRTVGGTYSDRMVFVARTSSNSSVDVSTLRLVVHHEIASVLQKRFGSLLPYRYWEQATDPIAVYEGDPWEAASNGRVGIHVDSRYNQQGFACPYGKVSREKDVNCIVMYLWCPTPEFIKALETYPRLRAKAIIAREWLLAIDPRCDQYLTQIPKEKQQ